jgi:formamidopyrimidine-DNA glycosylase
MPEYPDVTIYIERLDALLSGQRLQKVRLVSPFLLRSVVPPISSVEGKKIEGFERLGKRIVVAFEGDLFLVLHLMIAGRLHWRKAGCKVPRSRGLAAFDFADGSLLLTEDGHRKRAALYVVQGRDHLGAFDPGGLNVLESSKEAFAEALARENHTLKRSLTDPWIVDGIGNAYSDEILHRARLSPVLQTGKLTDEQVDGLYNAVRDTLNEWTERLREEAGGKIPERVTAFRPEMAVHGRYRKPCPECGTAVQRIRYADNETNYCPRCQTGGKLLADRSLSRLLKKDWPRTIEQLEARRSGHP